LAVFELGAPERSPQRAARVPCWWSWCSSLLSGEVVEIPEHQQAINLAGL
jgi:hypothetical protein